MFLAQEAGTELGALHALYLNRLFAVLGALVLVFFLLLTSKPLQLPTGNLRWLVLFQAVLETAALGAFLIGSANGGRIGAAVGFSAFAAATTIFAWIWLGEKIGVQRFLWIGIVGMGVVFAILGSPVAMP